MTTPSDPIGQLLIDDIVIVCSHRNNRAIVAALTQRGYNWIENNMTESTPVTIDLDAVDEIKDLIKKDGLSVIIR